MQASTCFCDRFSDPPARHHLHRGLTFSTKKGALPGSLFSCLLLANAGLAQDRESEQIGDAEALSIGGRLKHLLLLRAHSKTGYQRSTVRLFWPGHGCKR